MTDCPYAEMRDLLPDWVHGSLNGSAASQVARHVAACAACRAESELLRSMRSALHREPTIDIQRVAAAVTARTLGASHRRASPRPWRFIAGGIAVAASLLIGALLLRSDAGPAATMTPVAVTMPTGRAEDSAAARVPADSPALAVAPAAVPEPVIRLADAGLAGGTALAELGDDQLEALLRRLDAMEALPETSPAPAILTDFEVRE
jgi:hypothetical protein